ncbi:HAD-IIIC family phosphatase [Streptomyces sp. HU2014]|uniref:HAD-IIIC family phosphatase n=1 Tax=Streptomyces sp. HU2014 TaxID=2939414 RepID=UPI00200E07DE|nr:HAD-IIIC family phosphatase [Streptomyces sp. HU2014]UQI47377.1 HAD-IIIC family phosphatase [Streptomyces sp. HU2014]
MHRENPAPTTVKCLVWDLDNTLWQGTLLEDGEVRLRPGLRETVVELDSRGILNSVASKNDHDHAWARLEELGLAEYFVLPRIGWGPKSKSVRAIAEELNFAPGTIAFIDDQPFERAEVLHSLPEVRAYPAEQAAELTSLPEFSPATVTVDSRRRRAMYQASFRRDAERAGFDGPDADFLRSLDIRMRITRATPAELSRVEELTLRTSQMNATGVHYSEADLLALIDDPDHEVLVTTVTDRFGPYGAVGVVLVHRSPVSWRIKLLATSCRVVSLGAGTALLRWLTDQAHRAGVHLTADFRPTERNRMMEVAYRFAGFTGAEEDPCPCLPGPDPAGADARPDGSGSPVGRLHLVPSAQPAPDTLRLEAPDLSERTR